MFLERLRIWEAAPLATQQNAVETAISQIMVLVGIGFISYFCLDALGQKPVARMAIVIAIFGCVSVLAGIMK